MSPENRWLEDVFPTEICPLFRGHVSFQGSILSSFFGIIKNHYKDPYSTTSTMDSKAGFFFVALVTCVFSFEDIY